MFAGLGLGLMSLDLIGLEIVVAAGEDEHATETERVNSEAAKKVIPLRRKGNLLLTTLLLGNVSVNVLTSIITADLTSVTVTQLAEIIDIHEKQQMIDKEESSIIRGAMTFGTKTVRSVMTPVDQVFMARCLPSWIGGFSRILVHGTSMNDIVGTIHVKDLIFVDPKSGDMHTLLGIVTLEDVLEEILQAEILDEGDLAVHRSHHHSERKQFLLRQFDEGGRLGLDALCQADDPSEDELAAGLIQEPQHVELSESSS
ncbi:hypothetical protein AM588_10004572 [Phytophthora nicotianae]|uniref:Uncharacterized protein n=1 Tax=Phytophthora nicotianae TaxID=4792 RepID=A0A0W8DBL0_PHYNI|nr:hypothetical protein AM588_10004572 [Phytophthora nicotianae]